jgi:ZIP family zinc transporter
MRMTAGGSLLLASLLSGLSTPFGAFFILTMRRLSPSTLAAVLGLAAGVMVTVASTELIPAAVHTGGAGTAWLGAAVGGLSMAVLRAVVHRAWSAGHRGTRTHLEATGWFLAIALALHDVPEGLAIAAGDLVSTHLGVVIASAIALHNIPEGMSIAAPLKAAGVNPRRILTASLAIGLVTPLSTITAAWASRLATPWIASILAFAGGVMILVVLTDSLPEAWHQGPRPTLAGLLAGGLLMVLLARLHTG